MAPKLEIDKQALFRKLQYEPHEGQLKVHLSRAQRRVLACGVRWGKTLCAAMEGLTAALEPRERSIGWVVAPTYDLADKVFREILLIVARHLQHHVLSIKENERRIIVRNLAGEVSEVRAKSADNAVSLIGEGLDWLIVDEAARLKPEIWESHLSQRLIDKQGWAMLISTPRGKGYFYELFRRGQGADPAYESWNFPSWTNPHLDEDAIRAERDQLPERVFRQEYGAEFGDAAGRVFRHVRECARGEWRKPIPGAVYFVGLDLARKEDFTVYVILDEQGRVVGANRFRRLEWGEQIRRIAGMTRMYRNVRILVDATGVGDPICEALRRTGCLAEPFVMTNSKKAAIIDNLAMLLEREQIVLPRVERWPTLIDELEAYEYEESESGRLKTRAPYGMHDDCVIALALAAWNLTHNRPRVRFRRVKILRRRRYLR